MELSVSVTGGSLSIDPEAGRHYSFVCMLENVRECKRMEYETLESSCRIALLIGHLTSDCQIEVAIL